MKPQVRDLLSLLRKRRHTGVTALEALQEIGTFRLAARVADLRAEGYDVWTDLVMTEKGQRIAVYRLREKVRPLTSEERREVIREEVEYLNRPVWSDEELLTVAAQSGIGVRRA